MNRPAILRFENRPLYTILSHDPDRRGGIRTCTVRNNRTGRIEHGPDTDYQSCVRMCDRLSLGEDIFPHNVIQQSLEQMSLFTEVRP